MKRQFIIKSIFSICMVAVTSFGASAQQSKNVSVAGFDEVAVSSGIDLYITQGNTESAKVTAPEEIMDKVVLEKNGNILSVRFKDNFSLSRLMSNQSIKVYLNVKTLHGVTASGGSDVYSQNTIKTDRLKIKSSGGADIKLTINTTDLQIETSGGSDVELKGSAVNMTASSSGGSDIDAFELVTQYAKVSASGGSDAHVNVSKALEASASGGADLRYKGNASLKKTSSSKSGSVKRA